MDGGGTGGVRDTMFFRQKYRKFEKDTQKNKTSTRNKTSMKNEECK